MTMNEQGAASESENEAHVHAALSEMYYAPHGRMGDPKNCFQRGNLERFPNESITLEHNANASTADITTTRVHKRPPADCINTTRRKAARLDFDGTFEAGNEAEFIPIATPQCGHEGAVSKANSKGDGFQRAVDTMPHPPCLRAPSSEDTGIAASLEILSKLPSDSLLAPPLPLISSFSIRKETKPKHVCGICGKVFKRAHNLKIHGRLHTGDKPYACPFTHCDKDFRWKSSLVSHLNWHKTKMDETLPGFDGTAAGFELPPDRSREVQNGVPRTATKTKNKPTDAGKVAANSRLKKALLQQSQAQARKTAAIQAADYAIAAANEAAAEAASAADAAAKCDQEGDEVVAGEWAIPYAGKIWSSPTSQQAGPPSLSSATEEIAAKASKSPGTNLSWLVSPVAKLLPSHSNAAAAVLSENKLKEQFPYLQDPLSNEGNRNSIAGAATEGTCSPQNHGYIPGFPF